MQLSVYKRTQLAQVATLVPMARVFVGKTSDANTQLTGPKLREKLMLVKKIMAMPAFCAAALAVAESTGFVAKIADKMEKVTTKLPAPKMSGFLRPTRSRTKMMKLSKH